MNTRAIAKVLIGSGLWALAPATPTANAQAYPTKPIRLVVAVQPGGNLDLLGRAVAEKISEGLGQRMFVENRPGGNTVIGLANVARSAPDGYSFAMVARTSLIGPRMMKNPPLDPLRDLAGVSLIATLPLILVVHPSLPAKSVKELIALAKARPGAINCASSGNGAGSHLAIEMFNRMAGVRLSRIPYNGDGPAIIDLLGGQVPLKFDNISTSLPHVRAGKLRALGITTLTRSTLLPDLAAIAETLPGFEASVFNGMSAPAATPPEILARIHAEIVKFVHAPEIRSRFAAQGVELVASASPEQFTSFLKTEDTKWAKVMQEAGMKAE